MGKECSWEGGKRQNQGREGQGLPLLKVLRKNEWSGKRANQG